LWRSGNLLYCAGEISSKQAHLSAFPEALSACFVLEFSASKKKKKNLQIPQLKNHKYTLVWTTEEITEHLQLEHREEWRNKFDSCIIFRGDNLSASGIWWSVIHMKHIWACYYFTLESGLVF